MFLSHLYIWLALLAFGVGLIAAARSWRAYQKEDEHSKHFDPWHTN